MLPFRRRWESDRGVGLVVPSGIPDLDSAPFRPHCRLDLLSSVSILLLGNGDSDDHLVDPSHEFHVVVVSFR